MAPTPSPSATEQAMSLLAKHDKQRGPGCTIGQLAATTTDPVIIALLALIGETPHATMSRALTEATGAKYSQQTVGRHAAKECACPR